MVAFLLLFVFQGGLEEDLHHSIRRNLQSSFSDALFKTLSKTGDLEVIIPILSTPVLLEGAHTQTVKAMFVAGGTTFFLVHSLKYVVNRTRPSGPTRRFNSSFPSGHAAIAFFTAEFYGGRYSPF